MVKSLDAKYSANSPFAKVAETQTNGTMPEALSKFLVD